MTLDRALAACNGVDTALFFAGIEDVDKARAVCDICSQRRECLEAEMIYELGSHAGLRAGVYAGMTGQQRHSLEQRGDSLHCPCGELRDPIDLRNGLLACASCSRSSVGMAIPDLGDV